MNIRDSENGEIYMNSLKHFPLVNYELCFDSEPTFLWCVLITKSYMTCNGKFII